MNNSESFKKAGELKTMARIVYGNQGNETTEDKGGNQLSGNPDLDYYRQKASEHFGIPYHQVTSQQRLYAKTHLTLDSISAYAGPTKLGKFLESSDNPSEVCPHQLEKAVSVVRDFEKEAISKYGLDCYNNDRITDILNALSEFATNVDNPELTTELVTVLPLVESMGEVFVREVSSQFSAGHSELLEAVKIIWNHMILTEGHLPESFTELRVISPDAPDGVEKAFKSGSYVDPKFILPAVYSE